MKTIVVTLLTFFAAIISAFAQDFQGMAVYESKTSTADAKATLAGNREITPEMQKMFEERMKKMFENNNKLFWDIYEKKLIEYNFRDLHGKLLGRYSSKFLQNNKKFLNISKKRITYQIRFHFQEIQIAISQLKENLS